MQTDLALPEIPSKQQLNPDIDQNRLLNPVEENQEPLKRSATMIIINQTFDQSRIEEIVNPVLASHINWNDYDWPICCKIIHYNLNEIHPKIRATFTALYINFFLLLLVLFIKIVCHCFLFPKNDLNIIFVLCVSPFLALLNIINFYSAYRGLFYDDSFKVAFKITSITFIAFALVNVGVGEFIFDGIPRLLRYSEEEPVNVFVMFMLIFEFSVNGIFAIIEIATFTIFLVYEKKYDQ